MPCTIRPNPSTCSGAYTGRYGLIGVYLMQDIKGSSQVHNNIGQPLGTLLYTILQAIDTFEQQFASAFQSSLRPRCYAHSVRHGRAVAEAVLVWAASDGAALIANCPHIPPTGPEFWQPTSPTYIADLLQPCWGQLRPFALSSGTVCAPLIQFQDDDSPRGFRLLVVLLGNGPEPVEYRLG